MDVINLVSASLLASSGERWEHGGWWWPIWPLLWLVVLGVIVWAVTRRFGRTAAGGDRPREILAERFARGEIGGEEYRERLDALR